MLGEPCQEGQDEIAFADRVEKLGGAEQFDTGCTRVLGGRLQFQLAEPQPRARQLSIIGCRMASGHLEMCSHIFGSPRGLMGAAAPVSGAREHDRISRAVVYMRKVHECRRGIGEEAQRDPPGHKVEFGAIVWIIRGSSTADDLIGGLGLSQVE